MRVLLTRLSSLGDVVHTWPLANALVAAGHEVGWVVEREYVPLVASAPAVSRVIVAATRRWRQAPLSAATLTELRAAVADVRAFAADVVLDPQGLVKSAVWAGLSRCQRRIGFARAHRAEALPGLFYSETVQPPSDIRHVVDLNLALLTALGIDPPWGDQPDGRFLLAGDPPPPGPADRNRVALLPSTGSRAKTWPAERYAAFTRRCLSAGLRVLVVWGPGEERLAARLTDGAPPGLALAPPTTLPELAAILARCAAVVGGDTGPLHLAASLGVPTLGIYLATDPARNGPRGGRTRAVRADSDRNGPAVDEVFDALLDMLHAAPG